MESAEIQSTQPHPEQVQRRESTSSMSMIYNYNPQQAAKEI